jgi:hypothetical protein
MSAQNSWQGQPQASPQREARRGGKRVSSVTGVTAEAGFVLLVPLPLYEQCKQSCSIDHMWLNAPTRPDGE